MIKLKKRELSTGNLENAYIYLWITFNIEMKMVILYTISMDNNQSTLKYYLHDIKIKRGVTFYELSKIIGISNSHLFNIMHGHTNLTREVMCKICRAFSLDYERLDIMLSNASKPYQPS